MLEAKGNERNVRHHRTEPY